MRHICVWVALALAVRANLPPPPALRVLVSLHTGLSPVQIRVEVRQDVERLAGREVCVHLSGPESEQSCWTEDKPTPLMTRWFWLREPGTYEVWAGSGSEHSNFELVDVPAEVQR